MKLSVIIPCYNAGAFVEDCMASVLAQDMADFEVILIDDGSRDNTRLLAEAIVQKDERVRVLFQENAGVSAARNRGIDEARGEWLTFVDADDLLPEGAFSALLAAAGDEVDMVVGAHETFGDGESRVVRPQTRWMDRRGERRRRAVALRLIEGDEVLNIMCGKLIRRELVAREGMRLAREVAVAEDALFNLEAALCARGIAYVDEPVYRYRMHAASKMHTQTLSQMDTHEPWLLAMRAMLARRGMREAYFPALLDSAALRLYKDGGVAGVMRGFNARVVPLLRPGELDKRKLSFAGKALRALCLSGAYPAVYPLIYPFQVAVRKLGELCHRLRSRMHRN